MAQAHRLLTALALAAGVLAPVPAVAGEVPTTTVRPHQVARGGPFEDPWLRTTRDRELLVVPGDPELRIELHGADIRGRVRVIRERHHFVDDGWVAFSSGPNRNALYLIAQDGEVTRFRGDLDTDGSFVLDPASPRLALHTWDDDGQYVEVYSLHTGERTARYTAQALTLHAFGEGGAVWISARDDVEDPMRLKSWNPGNGVVQDEGLRGVDGLDLERELAWRFTGNRRLTVLPLYPEVARWQRWTVPGARGSDPAFSIDDNWAATYTRRRTGRHRHPYPGTVVLRDIETGEPAARFRGRPYGDLWWESHRRVVGMFYGKGLRVAQLRMRLDGKVRRVTRFARREVPRAIVDAPPLDRS